MCLTRDQAVTSCNGPTTTRTDWAVAAGLGLVLCITSAVVFGLHAVDPEWGSFNSDIRAHMQLTEGVVEGERGLSDRPLLHLLMIPLMWLPGVGSAKAIVAVLAVAYTSGYAATVYVLRRHVRNWRVAKLAVLAAAISVASAIYAPMFFEEINFGQGSPNLWHNPTQVLVQPFVILGFYAVERWLRTWGDEPGRWWGVVAGLLLLGSVLVKPNWAIAFIPALGLYAIVARSEKAPLGRVGRLVIIVGPTVGLLVLQYLVVFATQEPSAASDASAGVAIRGPNELLAILNARLWSAPLVLAFPLVALWVMSPRDRMHRGILLAWLVLGVAMGERLLLVETGPRMTHGNWHWGYYLAQKPLYIYSAAMVMRSWDDVSERLAIAWIVLALHAWSGVVYLTRIMSGEGLRG